MRKTDRRVERTKQLLLAAMLSLVQERGFEDLSVQDIIERANVGRTTFYAHFTNKDDLLVSGLEGFRTYIRERQRTLLQHGAASEDRAFLFSHEVFAHAKAHRDVFRAMVGKESGATVQRLFRKIMVELVREEVKAASRQAGQHAVSEEALVQYVAGGLWGLLSWWLDTNTRMPVDEIDAIFRQLAIPSVSAAMRRAGSRPAIPSANAPAPRKLDHAR